jgi:hypothetical protein
MCSGKMAEALQRAHKTRARGTGGAAGLFNENGGVPALLTKNNGITEIT